MPTRSSSRHDRQRAPGDRGEPRQQRRRAAPRPRPAPRRRAAGPARRRGSAAADRPRRRPSGRRSARPPGPRRPAPAAGPSSEKTRWLAGPAEPAHRRAEHHLGVPGGLLVAQPQGGLHGVRRRRSARRSRRSTRSSCPARRPAPPSRAKIVGQPGVVADQVGTLSPTPPKTRPSTANPNTQPASRPRCSRQASASGERRPGAAVAGPGRPGSRPAPKSRRPSSDHAEPAVADREQHREHGRPPGVRRRTGRCAAPSRSARARTARTPRRCRSRRCRRPAAARRPPPSAMIAIDRARCGRCWSAGRSTAATPANIQPASANSAPNQTEPAAGSPCGDHRRR